MVHVLNGPPVRRTERRERVVAGTRAAFDEAGVWIGTVNPGGAVYDTDGVQIGVVWPNGDVVDFHGMQIGKA
jgi:hypothetical protein